MGDAGWPSSATGREGGEECLSRIQFSYSLVLLRGGKDWTVRKLVASALHQPYTIVSGYVTLCYDELTCLLA